MAGLADGTFAEHGLDVELLEPAPGPENTLRVAAGGADFCLTSVNHYLTARSEAGALPARFVMVIVGRSPMAALVAASSTIWSSQDLPNRRVGGPRGGRLLIEYGAALAHLGLGPPVIVDVPYEEAPAALGRGEVEVIPDFIDLLPRTRRQAGIAIRGIPVGVDVYGSGLVAGDSVPAGLVERMCAAVEATLVRQRARPERGLDELTRRYPDVIASEAIEGWELAARQIFARPDPRAMDALRWRRTIDHATAAHGLRAPEVESVYRAHGEAPGRRQMPAGRRTN